MLGYTLFISDIHLQASEPEVTRRFVDFMITEAPKADALYILGDLFELWIGDDDDNPFHLEAQNIIKKVSDKIPVYFMRGNRDFLLGKRFANACGMKMLDDPALIDLYGKKILLSHGDLLCTDDVRHQKYRRIILNPTAQKIFAAIPLSFRRKIANYVRGKSKQYNRSAPQYITDVNKNAANELMQQHKTSILIHGHTHRPKIHSDKTTQKCLTRIVLGAWHDDCDYLKYYADGCYQLLKFS